MWLKMAMRNVLRNKRRTIVCSLIISLGLSSLMLVDALILGMEENLINTATSTFLGDGQIHQKGFRDAIEPKKTIRNRLKTLSTLNSSKDVKSYSERVISFAMISSPRDAQAINLYGVDTEKETSVSKLREAIIRGNYLYDDTKEILIGSRLAEFLDVNIGEKVVVTVAEALSGNLSQELFRIKGIFRFNSKEMDSRLAFVSINRIRDMLGLDNESHEIVVKMKNPSLVFTSNLWNELSKNDNEALGWDKLLPELTKILKLSKYSVWIMAFMLFLVIVFGIINTIFSSIYERFFEFGVIKSIGTKNSQLFKLILLESFSLSLISVIIGIIIAVVAIGILSKTGLNYGGLDLAGVTFQEPIYTKFRPLQFILYPVVIIIMTIIPSIYPAIFLIRQTPIKLLTGLFQV